MKENHTAFMGYRLFTGELKELPLKDHLVISTLNQYSYCVAEKDPDFKKALTQSDVLLPDGVGVVASVLLMNGKKIKKIAGDDLFKQQMEKLEKEKGRCFFLGSLPSTLNLIEQRLSKEYPSVTAGFFSPPFKPVFSDQDNEEMIAAVNAFRPDVLFVGMTAPKQEIWASRFKDSLDAKVICSIGAVFDFYAGTVRRPSRIWIDLGLEWFVRLLNEPKRLWKRYLYYGPVFVKMILEKKIHKA